MATPNSIGLDIGSVSIRAIEVSAGKERPRVDAFGEAALPAGAVVGGVVKDERVVTATLRQLWSDANFKAKSVRLGVTHQQVVVREVQVANVPAKEMRRALPHQVRDVLPLPADQAILDFHPLEAPDKQDMVRGLLIAAPKEAIIDTVRAVEKAGLHVDGVDLSCFAVLRAVAAAGAGPEVIIDIGAKSSLLIIHSGGVPQIVRTIPRGGNEITSLLASRLSMDDSEAEQHKRRFGVLADAGPEGAATVAIVSEAIRPLVSEIRSSVNYYLNAVAERRLERVCVVGGAGELPGLAELLGQTLGLPVHIGDPLQYIAAAQHRQEQDSLTRFRPSAAVSVGLILAAAS